METNFSFQLPNYFEDPNNHAKQYFINHVREHYPELTIIGLEKDTNALNESGIQYAWPGTIVELNTKKEYDIDWYGTSIHAYMNGVSTNLHLTNDWDTITKKLDIYAQQYKFFKPTTKPFLTLSDYLGNNVKKEVQTLSDGTKVEVYPAFVKIGLEIIPRFLDKKEFTLSKQLSNRFANVMPELTAIIIKK